MSEDLSRPKRPLDRLKRTAADLASDQAAAARLEAVPGSSAVASQTVKLRQVMERARQVTSILDLQPLLDTVAESFVAITGAERGVLLLEDENGTLQRRAAHNLEGDDASQRREGLTRGPIEEAASSGQSVFVDDVLAQGQYGARESVIELQLRSFSVVPLVHAGRVLGVCYTDSRQRGRPLTEVDRNLLESFAAQAALAIHNARRHAALVQAKSRLEEENRDLRRQIERRSRFENLLGESAAMQRLFGVLDKVVPTVVNVLLQGETGTGKELLARAIHCNGPLHAGPYVTVNAGALPEALLESELFGHRRGAFTTAIEDRRGLFEEADGGTLFLDEIGEMSRDLQVKLLRVLQDGEIRRVGDSSIRRVKVRIIAATNRDLTAEVRAGRFRDDLFYRLNVVGIHVPPLRERGNDVLLLAKEFRRRYAALHSKEVGEFTSEAIRWLLGQRWEGNVRELENSVERAVTLCETGSTIGPEHLRPPWALVDPDPQVGQGSLKQRMEGFERAEVQRPLEERGGRITAAAAKLGVSRQHLHTLIRKHGLGRTGIAKTSSDSDE
jgi:Nif-specific regulatory protein